MKNLAILLVLSLISCHAHKNDNGLPATRPTDLSLFYRVQGDMINRSDNLLITADSCVYDQNNEGQLTHKVFSLSGQELDELYSILQKDHFDKIRSENEDVTDRGGVTISLSWNKGQQKTEVDDMGTTSVLREHQKDWQQICNYIGRLLKNKTKLEPFTYYPEN